MLIAIDVGNTQTLLGVFSDDDELLAHWRLSTEPERTVDETGIQLRSLLELRNLTSEEVGSIVISSVVPPLTGNLRRVSQRYFEVEPLVVTPALVDDLPIRYEPPGDVGSDRIVNAVAAKEGYGAPVVVVDFGTATTFDVVDGEGAYLGGIIATGIGVSADALFARAARLPRVDVARPATVIGGNTVDSVRSGLYYGYADLVDGLIARIEKALEKEPRVVATGGWAETIGPECRRIQSIDPLLTLEGLRLIFGRYGAAG